MPRTPRKPTPAGEPSALPGPDPMGEPSVAAGGQPVEAPPAAPARRTRKSTAGSAAARTTRSRKRAEPVAAVGPEEVAQAEALAQRLCAVSGQVDELGRQAIAVRAELDELRRQRELAAGELEQLRRETQSARQEFRRQSAEVAEWVRADATATEQKAGEIAELFRQARDFLATLPRQAEEVARRLGEVQGRLPEIESGAASLRQALESAQEESRQARRRVEVLAEETTTAELRLVAARQTFDAAELELLAIEQQLEQAAEQAVAAGEQAEAAKVGAEVVAAVVEEAAEAALAAAPPPEGHNRLGVTVEPGVVVAEVLPGSPGAEGGLLHGDVVFRVNDTDLFTGVELRNRVQEAGDGEELTFHVRRAGQPVELKVRLGAPVAEQGEGHNRLGVTVEPGVVVAEVLPGTSAESAGLARGDVILTVDGADVLTAEQLRDAVLELPAHTEVVLRVLRGGESRDVLTRLDAEALEAQASGVA